ncbi:transposase [Rhodococcus sp. As11]|uniref:transposase n=1 Tax=Rhodococcus sp. As11 TaxID=3029189 RepID=UPI003B7A7EC9
MSVFPIAAHLASWAGTAPGSHESAGRIKSIKTWPGNRHLEGALGTAALAVSRSKGTFFSAEYKRLAARRGPINAIVCARACNARLCRAHAHQRRCLPRSRSRLLHRLPTGQNEDSRHRPARGPRLPRHPHATD